MTDEIDKIIKNSNKAELLERLAEELEKANKAVVVLISDKEDGSKYESIIMTLGLNNTYEAYGILEVGKQDLQSNDY